jgi:hypothetical protein
MRASSPVPRAPEADPARQRGQAAVPGLDVDRPENVEKPSNWRPEPWAHTINACCARSESQSELWANLPNCLVPISLLPNAVLQGTLDDKAAQRR